MVIINIKTKGGMNAREHFGARAKRVKFERQQTRWMLNSIKRPALPCSVLLTRVSWSSGLDDDNLASALKSVRDEIAAWLGVDDRDRATVRYRYAQRRSSGPKQDAVMIEFGEPASGAQLTLLEVTA